MIRFIVFKTLFTKHSGEKMNQVILIGNVGADPMINYTANGDAVCNFSVATTERWKDQNGQQKERTEWHNIVTWKKQAEICGQYLKKGRQVYITGKIQYREYEKDGIKKKI